MHFGGVDEDFEPRKRRRCRTSKKKRQRLKQRASLEPQVQQSARNRSENYQPLEKETRAESENQVEEQTQQLNTQEDPETEHDDALDDQEKQEEEQKQDERQHHIDDGVTDYERKRRENILRNQAWMQQLGFSSAKMAIRTAVCGDATRKKADEAKRQKERQAQRTAEPLRKSRRVRRATEVMNIARKPTRRYTRRSASEAFVYQDDSESDKISFESDTEGDDFMGESETEEDDIVEESETEEDDIVDESGTEEDDIVGESETKLDNIMDKSDVEEDNHKELPCESVQEEPKMNESAYDAERDDSCTKPQIQLLESPSGPLVEPKAHPISNELPLQSLGSDLAGDKPLSGMSHIETNHTSGVFQKNETQATTTQTSEHIVPSDAETSSQGFMAEFERKRRENILRNQAFMQQVGVSIAKLAARTSIGDEAGKEAKRKELAAKRELKAARRAEFLKTHPVRKSQRTTGRSEALSHPTALGYSLELLSMQARIKNNVNYMDAVDSDGRAFLKEMTGNCKKQDALKIDAIGDNVEYSLAKDDVAKALPFRTTAMAFLPRADRILLACGDKEGHISFWSPSKRAITTTALSSAALCRPHGFTVSQMMFSDSSTLLSSSVDGVVREFDLHTAKSTLVCDINDETGISSLITLSPRIYFAGCGDGSMRLIDRRARTMQSYELHEGAISTLDQHPSLPYCIATASHDRTVCFWDNRRISSHMSIPLTTIPHATSVDCAHFSPHGGNWLATATSEDSHINLFDTSIVTKRQESDPLPIPLSSPIRVHHKGFRGYEAKYMRVAWDPKKMNRFVIGCAGAPPRIKIFSAHQPARELRSANFLGASAVNIFHPYLDVIASGGGSGTISLWRGSPKP